MLRRNWFKILSVLVLTPVILFTACFTWIWFNSPNPARLQKVNPQSTSFMKRKCGKDCALVWTPLAKMSPFIPQAVIVAEDVRFYFHHGIDWDSLRAAFWLNLKEHRVVWGGSTITQQLAKNLYLSPEKTISRKLREFILTQKLERSLSKNRILEIYLNVAQWGPSLFGITAASQHYFGKAPQDLGPLEASYLASILPNPERADEKNFRERFTEAGGRVFDLLLQSYLPPIREDITEACEDRLREKESQQADLIVAKIFSTFANEIISGQAFLLTEKQLWKSLEPEEITFIQSLLQRKRERHPLSKLTCKRSDQPGEVENIPLAQASNEYGSRTYWIPKPADGPVQALLAKAKQDGIPLIVTSAYRGSGYQHYLLLAFLRQDAYCLSKTFQRVALPEESEHSCVDTPAIDFGILGGGKDVPFEQTETYRWLQANAPQAGFQLSYPQNNTVGMPFEPWHWRWGE